MKISLVLATVNRRDEVRQFCLSLKNQKYEDFELIVVDQNEHDFLKEMMSHFQESFTIKYVKSLRKGLSYARNLGLTHATGEIIAFPDDDCKYYEDTLCNVVDLFSERTDLTIIAGRIVDYDGTDVIRKWRKRPFKIDRFNYYHSISSVTIFVKEGGEYFDEELGAGTSNGSCEDVEYVYKYIRKGGLVEYNPCIRIWHPHQSDNNLEKEKIESYGRGFGFFIKKQMTFENIFLFLIVLFFHVAKMVLYLCTLKFSLAGKRLYYITSRLKGFSAR